MKYNPEIHHHRSIRWKDYDYSSAGAYFITACTRERENLFGEIKQGLMVCNGAGDAVHGSWVDLENHYENIKLDVFVVMPNHFHGIIFIVGAIHELPNPRHESPNPRHKFPQPRRKMAIPKIVGRFKMVSAKQINQFRETIGVSVWQRNYWEHIIRNEQELSRIRSYIEMNPTQLSLISKTRIFLGDPFVFLKVSLK